MGISYHGRDVQGLAWLYVRLLFFNDRRADMMREPRRRSLDGGEPDRGGLGRQTYEPLLLLGDTWSTAVSLTVASLFIMTLKSKRAHDP